MLKTGMTKMTSHTVKFRLKSVLTKHEPCAIRLSNSLSRQPNIGAAAKAIERSHTTLTLKINVKKENLNYSPTLSFNVLFPNLNPTDHIKNLFA